MTGDGDPGREARQRAIQRASAYTFGFLGVALFLTVAGAALVAWLLARTGLPFVTTWVVLMGVILVPSLLGLAWQGVKERTQVGRKLARGKGTGADDGG